jgi:hypothetical protein
MKMMPHGLTALVEYVLRHLYGQEAGGNPAAQLLNVSPCPGSPNRPPASWSQALSTACSTAIISTSQAKVSIMAPGGSTRHWNPRFTAAYFDHQRALRLWPTARSHALEPCTTGHFAPADLRSAATGRGIGTLSRRCFRRRLSERFLWRLGVASRGTEEDRALVEAAERAMIDAAIPIADFFHYHRGRPAIRADAMAGENAMLLSPNSGQRPMRGGQ